MTEHVNMKGTILMKNDQNQSNQSGQNQRGSDQKLDKTQLETLIRENAQQFGSQSNANAFLQKHGYSCQMKEDGTADIFEGQQNRIASVTFSGQPNQTDRQVKSISY